MPRPLVAFGVWVAIAMLFASLLVLDPWPRQRALGKGAFDADAWRAATPVERHAMVEALLADIDLVGWSRDEVVAFLGSATEGDAELEYITVAAGGAGSKALVLALDGQGHVESVDWRVRLDDPARLREPEGPPEDR